MEKLVSTIKCSNCGMVKKTTAFFKKDRIGQPICKACSPRDYDPVLEKFVCSNCGIESNRVVGDKEDLCLVCKAFKTRIRGMRGR